MFRAPRGGQVSDKALRELLAEFGVDATVHGFRSTLGGWARERGAAHEVVERVLAHRVGSNVSQAYQHLTDQLDLRRSQVMDPWGAFVTGAGG